MRVNIDSRHVLAYPLGGLKREKQEKRSKKRKKK